MEEENDYVKEWLFEYYTKNPKSIGKIIELVKKDMIFYTEQSQNCLEHITMLEEFKSKLED